MRKQYQLGFFLLKIGDVNAHAPLPIADTAQECSAWTDKMAQRVNLPFAKSDDPSIHTVEREKCFSSCSTQHKINK